MNKKMRSVLPILMLVGLLVALSSGCRRASVQPTPAPESTESTVPTSDLEPKPDAESGLTSVSLYFVRGEKIGVAAREMSALDSIDLLAKSAVAELLNGPTSEEAQFGLTTAVPAGSRVNGVTVENGTATVDLNAAYASGGGSLSMQLRVAQIVCTLTQFPEVKRVAFELDGKPVKAIGGEGIVVDPPVDRTDFENVLPPVLVETPAPGQAISSPVTISGSSNVFEATHQIEVTDPDGLIIAKKVVTATSGTGTRGTWKESVSFGPLKRSGLGAIIVFEYSAEDGSRINIVEIPVRMEK